MLVTRGDKGGLYSCTGVFLAQSGKSLFKWRSGPERLDGFLIDPLTYLMIIQLTEKGNIQGVDPAREARHHSGD
jgi:hypothetical protein